MIGGVWYLSLCTFAVTFRAPEGCVLATSKAVSTAAVGCCVRTWFVVGTWTEMLLCAHPVECFLSNFPSSYSDMFSLLDLVQTVPVLCVLRRIDPFI
jgi:hypothetical protein